MTPDETRSGQEAHQPDTVQGDPLEVVWDQDDGPGRVLSPEDHTWDRYRVFYCPVLDEEVARLCLAEPRQPDGCAILRAYRDPIEAQLGEGGWISLLSSLAPVPGGFSLAQALTM